MGPLDFSLHLLNFAAPALALAIAVSLGARVFLRKIPQSGPWWRHALINTIVGVLVLTAGLWYFGVDGKMATYAALAGVVATSQWLLSRACPR